MNPFSRTAFQPFAAESDLADQKAGISKFSVDHKQEPPVFYVIGAGQHIRLPHFILAQLCPVLFKICKELQKKNKSLDLLLYGRFMLCI